MNGNVEIGDAKSINCNPIAERAVRDFNEELCKVKSDGGEISNTDLSMILSSIIRFSGFSAIEIRTQRDMLQEKKFSLT